jgi:hypothetical protein
VYTERLSPSAWQHTLEDLTMRNEGGEVTIDVIRADVGDQKVAEAMPFVYLEYDPHDDAASVAVSEKTSDEALVRHVVEHPLSIYVARSPQSGPSLELNAADGTTTIVTFLPRHFLSSP